jgi:hypothetical protein
MDLEDVAARVRNVLQLLHRDEKEISMGEIEAFCRHAGYLKVFRFRSLEEEYSSPRTKFIRTLPPSNPPFLPPDIVGFNDVFL